MTITVKSSRRPMTIKKESIHLMTPIVLPIAPEGEAMSPMPQPILARQQIAVPVAVLKSRPKSISSRELAP